jgi:hypothetical protein
LYAAVKWAMYLSLVKGGLRFGVGGGGVGLVGHEKLLVGKFGLHMPFN